MEDVNLIEAQKNWISLLVQMNKGRPLLGQYTEGDMDNFKKKWTELNRHDVILTRQILKNEIVFDFDYPDWKPVYKQSKKLVEYLKSANIPHIIASSGGKGIHVHLFIDPISIEIMDDANSKQSIEDIAKYNIDVPRLIRKTVYDKIVEMAKLKVATPKDRSGLDTTKVYFTTANGGMGSLIRDFGCPRRDGNHKSMILGDIPKDKPEAKDVVMFPTTIEMVDARRWNKHINQELQKLLYKSSKASEPISSDFKSKGLDVPCYYSIMKGTDKGIRNVAVFTLARLGSLVGNTYDETMKDTRIFCRNSQYQESEAEQTVKSAYRYQDRKPFCGSIIYNFGSEVCDKRNCPVHKFTHPGENK